MTGLRLAVLLMAGTSPAAAAAGEGRASPIAGLNIAQVSIREQVIIRVQTQHRRAPSLTASNKIMPQVPAIKWKEKKAPQCIALRSLAGASVTQSNSVDLVLRGGQRMRARLEDDCPALDFYDGFYIKPTEDGRMCADRDTIHSRSGGQCEITRFRTLVPDR